MCFIVMQHCLKELDEVETEIIEVMANGNLICQSCVQMDVEVIQEMLTTLR